MRPVLTPEEAGELDRGTQARGVPATELMERAGRAVARAAVDVAGGVYGRRAVVLCGRGNNGGDGFVAARHLARAGVRVDVITTSPAGESAGPAGVNAGRLAETGLVARPWSRDAGRRLLGRADVAVDALFGIGFRGRAEGVALEAIEELNASPAPVCSVDLPSGVDGASGAVDGQAVWAALTVAIGAVKVGSVLLPGAERSGTIRVVDIGFPGDLVRPAAGLVEGADVAAVLPVRDLSGHKRSTGVLLVVAGSRAMTGAPALIARAAGRAGAGLVTVATASDAIAAAQSHAAEAVFAPLEQTDEGTVSIEALERVLELAGGADAVALGPGLTRHEQTAGLVRALVRRCPVPLVLDADGLNAFEGDAEAVRDRACDLVVTPHDGEFARLLGRPVTGEPDRLAAARTLAEATDAVALLKGTRTVIATPAGEARVNPTGSPVLATAGTGDVLTGVIGGLLARGLDPLEAATAGAFLHGVAGRLAGIRTGEGTLALDVADRIPDAVAEVIA